MKGGRKWVLPFGKGELEGILSKFLTQLGLKYFKPNTHGDGLRFRNIESALISEPVPASPIPFVSNQWQTYQRLSSIPVPIFLFIIKIGIKTGKRIPIRSQLKAKGS